MTSCHSAPDTGKQRFLKPIGGLDVLIRGPQTAPGEGEAGDGRAATALVVKICWYYFREGQTQDSIAQRLKTTRNRVNRILGESRESGFVQITIAYPSGPRTEIEEELIR